MKRKRRQYSGAFKAKIGLEALIGIKTTAQIARENNVHPLLVGQWKAIIRERMPELFERGHQAPDDSEKMIAQLHQKIGQLNIDYHVVVDHHYYSVPHPLIHQPLDMRLTEHTVEVIL